MKTHDLAGRLARCYTGAVYDAARELGALPVALPPEIRLLDPNTPLAGPVFTVDGSRKEGISEHECLLSWTSFLSEAPSGHVVICQPHDTELAHMGELSAQALHVRGVRGYLVDGGARDTRFIRRLGFPVACRYTTPADIVGLWSVDALGEPIEIGGLTITVGDLVLADRDGAVVVAASYAKEVVERAEELMSTESDLRRTLRNGADPRDAYLRYGIF